MTVNATLLRVFWATNLAAWSHRLCLVRMVQPDKRVSSPFVASSAILAGF